jgi:hypothetical protein
MKKRKKKKKDKKRRKKKKMKKKRKRRKKKRRSRVLDPVRLGNVGLAHLHWSSPTRRQRDALVSRLECTNPRSAWCESGYSH